MKKVTKNTTDDDAVLLGVCKNRCGNCCQYGSGYVLNEEIGKLARAFRLELPEFEKRYLEKSHYRLAKKFKTIKKQGRPYGRCIFYNVAKGCTIHAIKPLHCRVGTCSKNGRAVAYWFLANHLLDLSNPEDKKEYMALAKKGVLPWKSKNTR